jgi:hypothetical protein
MRYGILLHNPDETAASVQADKLLNLGSRIHGACSETVLNQKEQIAQRANAFLPLLVGCHSSGG